MLRVLKSHSAAERIAAATEFVLSFPPATELLIIGASRDARITPKTELHHGGGKNRHSVGLVRHGYGTSHVTNVVPASPDRPASSNFAPVAKFPGFARATATTIGELRAAGVATKNLKRLDESGPDNAALLERFEQEMKEVSVADRTILFRTALEEVRAGAELAKHPMLLIDVPIHSAIEKEFVAPLAAASQNVLITCLA
jgi:hypothetical protein